MKNRKSFEEYVIESILANNGFDIKLVSKIITLQSRYFVQGEYILIEDLIAQKKSELVNEIENIPVDKNEFLYIMRIWDQNDQSYIVTVFDSNELSQDPQVIQIYR